VKSHQNNTLIIETLTQKHMMMMMMKLCHFLI